MFRFSLQDVKQRSNGHDSHSSHGSLVSVSDRSLVDKEVGWQQDIRRYAAEMWDSPGLIARESRV